MLSSIPVCIFSSFIVTNLSYKSIIIVTDRVMRSNSCILKNLKYQKPSDTIFCDLCDIDDDENVTYSQADLIYVLELLNSPKKIENKIENTKELKEKVQYLNIKVVNF